MHFLGFQKSKLFERQIPFSTIFELFDIRGAYHIVSKIHVPRRPWSFNEVFQLLN